MSEILMCDKCKRVFNKDSKAVSVEINFTTKDLYGYNRVVDKEYDLCGECARRLLEEFESPTQLEAETSTIRL